jgi:hypothetical protein
VGTRTSGSEGGGEQTTARKRGMAARLRPYFSIVQRKVLTPNDFDSPATVARRLNEFERSYNEIAEPFGWRFTREDLSHWLERLAKGEAAQLAPAA